MSTSQDAYLEKRTIQEEQELQEKESWCPEGVAQNRELQKERNKKRKRERSTMIVNTDALILQPRRDGAYLLSRVKKNMIVNRNALSLQPSVDGVYALFKLKKQKIVNRNALMTGEQ